MDRYLLDLADQHPIQAGPDCKEQVDHVVAALTERVLPVLREFSDMVCVCHKSYVDRGLEDPKCEYHRWEWGVTEARKLVAELEDSQ
jgi:hypothetical protein